MAIYQGTTLVEQPIYGSGRIGVWDVPGKTYQYELNDHLGNVRTVLHRKSDGTLNLVNAADYYAFGESFNNATGFDYRNGYQRQYAERDLETNLNSFELRIYNARLGRWTSTDPYGQYASPYVGMGNNPINGVDPDGGFKTKFGTQWYSFWNGGDVNQALDVAHKGEWFVAKETEMMGGASSQRNFDWGHVYGPLAEAKDFSNKLSATEFHRYEGILVVSSPFVTSGSAFTPANFVVTASDISYKTKVDRDLLRHEFGHVATYNAMGGNLALYTLSISIPSVINHHTGLGGAHKDFYTEKVANTFSEWIYGPFDDPNRHPSYNPPKK